MQKELSGFQYARNFMLSLYLFVALGYAAYTQALISTGAVNDDFVSFNSGGVLTRSLLWPVQLLEHALE